MQVEHEGTEAKLMKSSPQPPKRHRARIDDPAQRAEKSNVNGQRRANDLDGAQWTRYSISVWNDLYKTPEEIRLNHPAMFPAAIVERLIDCFTTSDDQVVLDPFMGSGSVIVAAQNRAKTGIGFETSAQYIALATERLNQGQLFTERMAHRLIHADARQLGKHVEPESVDLCVTSPPYWNILDQKRSADYKPIRNYGDSAEDLGKILSYERFLSELTNIFSEVLVVLRPGKYCVVNLMDLRKKDRFFPFHCDLSRHLAEAGWIYDDLIIWDRRREYNNLRPLGFPAVFRINKIHEYLLIFRKPGGRS